MGVSPSAIFAPPPVPSPSPSLGTGGGPRHRTGTPSPSQLPSHVHVHPSPAPSLHHIDADPPRNTPSPVRSPSYPTLPGPVPTQMQMQRTSTSITTGQMPSPPRSGSVGSGRSEEGCGEGDGEDQMVIEELAEVDGELDVDGGGDGYAHVEPDPRPPTLPSTKDTLPLLDWETILDWGFSLRTGRSGSSASAAGLRMGTPRDHKHNQTPTHHIASHPSSFRPSRLPPGPSDRVLRRAESKSDMYGHGHGHESGRSGGGVHAETGAAGMGTGTGTGGDAHVRGSSDSTKPTQAGHSGVLEEVLEQGTALQARSKFALGKRVWQEVVDQGWVVGRNKRVKTDGRVREKERERVNERERSREKGKSTVRTVAVGGPEYGSRSRPMRTRNPVRPFGAATWVGAPARPAMDPALPARVEALRAELAIVPLTSIQEEELEHGVPVRVVTLDEGVTLMEAKRMEERRRVAETRERAREAERRRRRERRGKERERERERMKEREREKERKRKMKGGAGRSFKKARIDGRMGVHSGSGSTIHDPFTDSSSSDLDSSSDSSSDTGSEDSIDILFSSSFGHAYRFERHKPLPESAHARYLERVHAAFGPSYAGEVIANQPNFQHADFPLHIDQPQLEGFGNKIVTLGVKGDGWIVVVRKDGKRAYRFKVGEGDAWGMVGRARTEWSHGVICEKYDESDDPDDITSITHTRVSLNIRIE
ncbi:hypothetical protein HDU93_007110 [Gonapodya sp. JEL0774]|nr:hypothetical protein HDU93_007110 [Gonapodya sp. JEL0774]